MCENNGFKIDHAKSRYLLGLVKEASNNKDLEEFKTEFRLVVMSGIKDENIDAAVRRHKAKKWDFDFSEV